MKKQSVLILTLALVALFVVSCGSAPTPTPAPTQPPLVITVVITPTPLPATATPSQPTLTPIPTVAVTTTLPTAVPPTKAAVVATKPPVVRTATKPAVAPTATALPLKFAAPQPFQPLWQPPWNDTQKDEVKFPGSAMVFRWKPVGGLGGEDCYLLSLTAEPINANVPARSDSFLNGCGDQTAVDAQNGYGFTLYQPGKGSPNYSSLLMDASEMWVSWSVTVVKNLGQCSDAYHCKTAPLSPASYRGKFLFKGGG